MVCPLFTNEVILHAISCVLDEITPDHFISRHPVLRITFKGASTPTRARRGKIVSAKKKKIAPTQIAMQRSAPMEKKSRAQMKKTQANRKKIITVHSARDWTLHLLPRASPR
jgi:hypothetical protein